MTDNLALWNAVETTPRAHTKPITGKSYQGTSPKPHYLVHKATETFGPIGLGGGFTIEDVRVGEGAGGERMHIARVKVWYKWAGERGEVEHIGGTQFCGTRNNGKAFTDEDAPKKSVTDALVKALSMIGFAGDIFMGRYDDSKYVAELREEARQESNSAPQQGRNAPASSHRTSADAGAPPSEAYKLALNAMKMSRSRAELREWFVSNKENIANSMPGHESLLLVGERNTLALTLPEHFAEAAE